MEYSPWYFIMGLLAFMLLFFIVTPLHELSHVAVLKLWGCKNKLRVVLLQFKFDEMGCVTTANGERFEFPARYRNIASFISFSIGLAGGWGCAGVILALSKLIPASFYSFKLVFFTVAALEVMHGLSEALENINKKIIFS